ncbi:hypothetical protein HNW77_06400 [Komagataeibacter sp. AV436]|uniref:Transposase n=1 Tax=Komagataeibacter melomenusus TaxID=2766578 RepID=A0ABX2ADU3_9PROT|nr:hypothetical protein [Komagataeibacter melomenusus]NPC66024.1 hypothetical protein [Komagataeibacter melomenusus]
MTGAPQASMPVTAGGRLSKKNGSSDVGLVFGAVQPALRTVALEYFLRGIHAATDQLMHDGFFTGYSTPWHPSTTTGSRPHHQCSMKINTVLHEAIDMVC